MIFGIGCDLVDEARFRKSMARRGGAFCRRIFTDVETEYCQSKKDPIPHFAARFAAKEAFLKALRTGWSGGIGWRDVGVVNQPSGAPDLVVTGKARDIFDQLGGRQVHVSLAHAGEYAIATVVIET